MQDRTLVIFLFCVLHSTDTCLAAITFERATENGTFVVTK